MEDSTWRVLESNRGRTGVKSFFKQLLRTEQRIPEKIAADPDFRFLQSNKLLSGLSVPALLFLFSRIVQRRYSRREMIFRDRNPGVCMFLIRQGGVELFIEDDSDAHIHLASLAEGVLFGEIATVTGYSRTASARADQNDTLLLSISMFDLDDLNKNYPVDALCIQRGITMSVVDSLIVTTDQLQDAHSKIEQLNRQIATYERQ